MSGLVTRQIRVSGLVQGVGFRAALREEARRRGVRGWVRNRSDGSVEALVHGSAHAVEEIVAWARRGPPGARVTEVQTSEAAAPHESADRFELRPTV